ncbi:MAG: alpha/beta hydrolase family protein [Anaerolineae bacterium]|jgi:pimeloyl-ACP methyl ester carboxylesterase
MRHMPDLCRLLLVIALGGVCLIAPACGESADPPPPPSPTPRPSPTVSPQEALEGSLFVITLDDELLAVEEIHVDEGEEQLLVSSELRRATYPPVTERRTLVLDPSMTPVRYDLEIDTLGVRSIWAAQREGDAIHVLSNNLEWPAPVLIRGHSPAPEIMIESAPSALPYVLLALRHTQIDAIAAPAEEAPEPALYTLDVLEDYPVSRPIAITPDPERQGAVIGTIALEVRIEDERHTEIVVMIHPGSRTLYSAEMEDYRPGLWPMTGAGAPSGAGWLVIRRVSRLPELLPEPEPIADAATYTEIGFTGADGTERAGTLALPHGAGPFPCVVFHSPGGPVPRVDAGDLFAQRGWAVYSYDVRGLGQSQGDYERGPIGALAADAVMAAGMLRERPEIDEHRIVYLGVSDAAAVGALALAMSDDYAVAALGCPGAPGSLFPSLTEYRIAHILAPFYEWDEDTAAAYHRASVETWQEWLSLDYREVALLRRRASLQALHDLADTDPSVILTRSDAPILLLQGMQDEWTPPEGAAALLQSLPIARRGNITLRLLDDVGHGLADPTGERPLAPAAVEALFEWLDALPASPQQ